LLYAASTLYHMVRNPRLKHVLRIADHSCIYLLIAGSYTPFTLTVMRGGIGWTLFMVVWAIALVGIAIKVFTRYRYGFVPVLMYLAMGWLVVLALRPTLEVVPVSGVLWLLAGGLAYTGGVFFFAMERIPYNHALWHLCVMAGSACHYLAVMLYVVPPAR
jgi:hemolysin III